MHDKYRDEHLNAVCLQVLQASWTQLLQQEKILSDLRLILEAEVDADMTQVRKVRALAETMQFNRQTQYPTAKKTSPICESIFFEN